MSAADKLVLASIGIGDAPDRRIKRLDDQIDGLREAGRWMGEAQRCARFRAWSGRSSGIAIHAIANARARIAREVKKLRDERERIEALP